MGYRVMVDDNFHYMDPDERYQLAVCDTEEEARALCIGRLEADLRALAADCSTPSELVQQWMSFGEDPFVVATDGSPGIDWSARDHVREHAARVLAAVHAAPSPSPDGATR